MKTLIKPFVYIMSALMVLSFASCNDFLDKEPEGKVPEEKVDYTNLSNMYQPVSGVYAKIRTSGLHWVIWEITTIRDQDVFSGQWNGSDYYNLSEYIRNKAKSSSAINESSSMTIFSLFSALLSSWSIHTISPLLESLLASSP